MGTMTTLDVLRDARDLLNDPARWTQGAHARDHHGGPVGPAANAACAWCLLGALRRVARSASACDAAEDALHYMADIWDLAIWNDHPGRTHADIIAALDRAIEAQS